MVYEDVALWQADHKLLGFRDPKALPTVKALIFRIEQLQRQPDIDEAAVAAAGERMLAWCNAGEPVPRLEPPKPSAEPARGTARNRAGQGSGTAQDPEATAAKAKAKKKATAIVKAAEAAYNAALAGQYERFKRRRSGRSAVDPTAKPQAPA